jgi:shikimate kinase
MQDIYLVGFMGTGKTAVGRYLAKSLGLELVDIDDLIVKNEGRGISDIFAQSGEPYFRKAEKEALKEVAAKARQVVDCGGGIVIDPENIAIMKQSGRLVCLSARPEVILERTKRYTHRPLLNVADPLIKINELLEKRKSYYAKADFTVDTSDLTIQQVAEKILEWLKAK